MELLKTVVAFFLLMIGAFLNFFLLTVVHDIVPRSDTQRLPDLVFILIEQQRWVGSLFSLFMTIFRLGQLAMCFRRLIP
jgi:hypothetical protein